MSASCFVIESSSSSSLHLAANSSDNILSFSNSCSNELTLVSRDIELACAAFSCDSSSSLFELLFCSSCSAASIISFAEANSFFQDSASLFILESSSSNSLHLAANSADSCLPFSTSSSKEQTLASRDLTSD
uniref:Uncharacterized protein n=1 Tax=Opuntia streptacantha TaxID=393608 RepID=A0A7C8YRK8_OPUST